MVRHGVGEDPALPGPRTLALRYDPGVQVHYGADLGNYTDPIKMFRMLEENPSVVPYMPDPDYDFLDLTEVARNMYDDQLHNLTTDDIALEYLNRVGITVPPLEGNMGPATWALENNYITGATLRTEGAELLKRRRNEAVLDAYREFGIDSASYPNDYEGLPGTESVMIVNPEQVRSVNARFDPRLRHLKHLMAGGAGATVLPYSIADER